MSPFVGLRSVFVLRRPEGTCTPLPTPESYARRIFHRDVGPGADPTRQGREVLCRSDVEGAVLGDPKRELVTSARPVSSHPRVVCGKRRCHPSRRGGSDGSGSGLVCLIDPKSTPCYPHPSSTVGTTRPVPGSFPTVSGRPRDSGRLRVRPP